MTARQERLLLVLVGIVGIVIAGFLVVKALDNSSAYFYSPSQVANHENPIDKAFRVGGMVVMGSLKRDEKDNLDVLFQITDNVKVVSVRYHGILPDLFKEGQGVIAQGKIVADGTFNAAKVLAKHDENYMPPEAAAAMQKKKQQTETPQP